MTLFEEITSQISDSALAGLDDAPGDSTKDKAAPTNIAPPTTKSSADTAVTMPGAPKGSFMDSVLMGDSGMGDGLTSEGAIQRLLSDEHLLMTTDLNRNSIPIVARVLTLAVRYRAQNLWNFVWNYLKLRVSLDRKGREEVVTLALRSKGYSEYEEDF